jgi:hypothetical protein
MALYPCPECRNDISEKAKSCPSCGAIWAGICPDCHTFREPSATKCAKCGYPFSKVKVLKEKADGFTPKSGGVWGRIWFAIWTFLIIPIGAFYALAFGVLFLYAAPDGEGFGGIGLLLLVLVVLRVFVLVGLVKRRLWAWNWNWVLIFDVGLGLVGIPMIDAIGDVPPAEVWFPIGLVISIAWVVPNVIYWRKRKDWFVRM